MEGALTFQDIFKSSFLQSGGLMQSVTGQTLLRAGAYLMLSLLLGLLIGWLYRRTYAGVVYSRAFATALVGMTVITCAIIVTIQTNAVLSLGMVGALSIVRYRTAVKDPMDLLYLFWCVASGIATGAGLFWVAVFAFAVLAVTLLVAKRVRSPRDEMYILLMHYQGGQAEDALAGAMGANRYRVRSKTVREGATELAVEVRVRKNDTSFVDRLKEAPGVEDASLVYYSGDWAD